MAASETDIPGLLKELDRLVGTTDRLTAAVADVDRIINLIQKARDDIADASSSHSASLTLARLQNPVKEGFEAINNDLKGCDRVQKDFGKVLAKRFPVRALPAEHDAMAEHPDLINRAITWHLLREGQFNVASTFIAETEQAGHPQDHVATHHAHTRSEDIDMDGDLDDDDEDDNRTIPNGDTSLIHGDTSGSGAGHGDRATALPTLESHQLQEKFSIMYSILSELKQQNLLPAIQWAHQNTKELEARGSDLEFELCKRQYIHLIWQSQGRNGQRGGEAGLAEAMTYARLNFPRFAERHANEIRQLASALTYTSNLPESPYASLFSQPDSTSFDDITASFTREFCSLLGLSAESPLYVAATAGAISLPQLTKYVEHMTAARASWTTESELAFETPLPRSMIYHSIFVCPVSKEQTTDKNPPMMLPCGHVLARDSLRNLVRTQSKYKCPYCPLEGHMRDARQVIL